MNIQQLVARRVTKKVSFMGEEIEIAKLSIRDVEGVQELVKSDSGTKETDLLFFVLRRGVVGLEATTTDDDLRGLPLQEVAQLSEEIMTFSGLGKQPTPEKS